MTATQVDSVPDPFTGAPTAFGFDFNPVVDRIRTTNNEPSVTSDNNYRYNPNNGRRVAIDGDIGLSSRAIRMTFEIPNIVGAAYTNNIDGATSTALYDIDSDLDILALQSNPNAGTLQTVGGLGVRYD